MAKVSDEIKRQIKEREDHIIKLSRALCRVHPHFPLSDGQWEEIAETVVSMGFTNRGPNEQSVVPATPIKKVRKRPVPKATPDNVVTNQDLVKAMAEKELEDLEPLVESMEADAAVRRAESKRMEKIKKLEEAKAVEGAEDWVKAEVKTGPKVFKRPDVNKMTAKEREALRVSAWRKKINHTFLETLGNRLGNGVNDFSDLNYLRSMFRGKYGFPGTMGGNDGSFLDYECLIDEHGALFLNGEPWLGEKNNENGKPLIRIPSDMPAGTTPVRYQSFGITLWIDTRVSMYDKDGEDHLKKIEAYGKAFADFVQQVAWHGLPLKDYLSTRAKFHYGDGSIGKSIATLEIEDVFRVNNSPTPLGTALQVRPNNETEVLAFDPKLKAPVTVGPTSDVFSEVFKPIADAMSAVGRSFNSAIESANRSIVISTPEKPDEVRSRLLSRGIEQMSGILDNSIPSHALGSPIIINHDSAYQRDSAEMAMRAVVRQARQRRSSY